MSIFNKLSDLAKLEILKEAGFDSFYDLQRSLHLMSVEDLEELRDKIEDILEKHEENLTPPKEEDIDFHTELEDIQFSDDGSSNKTNLADDLHPLIELADSLDRRGLYDAAKIIDETIKNKVQKLSDPMRVQAARLRKKFAEKEKYYAREELEQLLNTKWSALTDKFKNRARAMRSTFEKPELDRIVWRWIDTGFGTGGKKKDAYDIPPPLTNRDIPSPLTQKDIPGPLTQIPGPPAQKDIPGLLTQQDVPKSAPQKFPTSRPTSTIDKIRFNIEKRLNISLEGLSPRQVVQVSKIRNPGLARQWVEFLRRRKAIRAK